MPPTMPPTAAPTEAPTMPPTMAPTTAPTQASYKLIGRSKECSESKRGQRRTLKKGGGMTVEKCYQEAVNNQACGNFFEVGSSVCLCYSGGCTGIFTDPGEDLYEIIHEASSDSSRRRRRKD